MKLLSTYRSKGRIAPGFFFSKNPLRRIAQRCYFLRVGPGAGYTFEAFGRRWTGITFYLAINCRKATFGNRHMNPIKLLQVGATRNGNLKPYPNH